jgi:hypothetical protein
MMPLDQSGRVRAPQETPHLSRQQRLDIVKMSAAGLISVIFFAAPVVLSRETSSPERPSLSAQTRSTAAVDAAPRVTVVTTEVAAAVSVPALQTSRGISRAVQNSRSVVPAVRWTDSTRRSRQAPARTRMALSRIARLFAGDGTHTIRPFPTVSAMR